MIAFIKRGPACWGVFEGSLWCEQSDGTRYRRKLLAYLEDEQGRTIVTESGGFARLRYRFSNNEPDLLLRYRIFRPNLFRSEGWSGTIARVAGSYEEYRCDRFEFLCDRESEMIRLELADPAWLLRTIVIGFHVFERCFPSHD
jgi:hypothetical protein